VDAFLKTLGLEPLDIYLIPACAFLFLLFWKTMARLVFNPMLDLIAERERATVGAQEIARDAIEQATRLEAQYEEILNQARVEGMRQKFELLEAARKESEGIIGTKEKEAAQQLESERAETAKTVNRARSAAQSELSQLADDIARRLVEPTQRTG